VTKVLAIIYDFPPSHHLTARVSHETPEFYTGFCQGADVRPARRKKLLFFLRNHARGDEQEITASGRGGNRVDRHTTLLWSDLAVLPIFSEPFGS